MSRNGRGRPASHREANDGRVRRHRYHPVERVGLERLGTGRGGSVRRAGDRGVQCLRSGGQVIIVITLYGHGDGAVDDQVPRTAVRTTSRSMWM